MADKAVRALRLVASMLDPRAWLHVFRIVHYYNYSHVAPKRLVTIGPGVSMAPNVSFLHAQHIELKAGSHVGPDCRLWAGPGSGRIVLGAKSMLAPEVQIYASNYQHRAGVAISAQPRDEGDVIIGEDCWIGAGTIIVAGVEIGDGTIVGAGSVVSRSLPPNSIAVGSPAKVVAERR
jgi:UDP-3-O-[3-hydroxymyristoyl] glucosamine N-acyltransferase